MAKPSWAWYLNTPLQAQVCCVQHLVRLSALWASCSSFYCFWLPNHVGSCPASCIWLTSLPLKIEMLSGGRPSAIENCWSLSTPRICDSCWYVKGWQSPRWHTPTWSGTTTRCALLEHGIPDFELDGSCWDCHNRSNLGCWCRHQRSSKILLSHTISHADTTVIRLTASCYSNRWLHFRERRWTLKSSTSIGFVADPTDICVPFERNRYCWLVKNVVIQSATHVL